MYDHILLSFFWISLNYSMSILTKHFGSSAALEGDRCRRFILGSCLHPGPGPCQLTGCFFGTTDPFYYQNKEKNSLFYSSSWCNFDNSSKLAKLFPHCLQWILQWVHGWANGYARRWAQRDALECGRLYRQPWLTVLTFKHNHGCEWIYTIKFQIEVRSYMLVLPHHVSWLNFFNWIIPAFSWFSKKQTIYSKVYTFEKFKKIIRGKGMKPRTVFRCYRKHKCFCERCHLCMREIISCVVWAEGMSHAILCLRVGMYIRNGWNMYYASHVMLKSISCHMVLYVNNLTIFVRLLE